MTPGLAAIFTRILAAANMSEEGYSETTIRAAIGPDDKAP